MWQLIVALPTSLWLQISHSINKEESSIREGSKKSNLEGDTEGENLQEQENNNKPFNKIKNNNLQQQPQQCKLRLDEDASSKHWLPHKDNAPCNLG